MEGWSDCRLEGSLQKCLCKVPMLTVRVGVLENRRVAQEEQLSPPLNAVTINSQQESKRERLCIARLSLCMELLGSSSGRGAVGQGLGSFSSKRHKVSHSAAELSATGCWRG